MKNSLRFSKLRVENLEDRMLLAVAAGGLETVVRRIAPTESETWVVNTLEDSWDWTADDDVVSLREAIDRSAEGDQIVFDESLAGGTIVLCGDQLKVSTGITIDASSAGGITIDADDRSRIFHIKGGSEDVPVTLIGLKITDGYEFNGGGIYFTGSLVLTDCTVTRNTALGKGGGIYNSFGTLTLTNSSVTRNYANTGGNIYDAYSDADADIDVTNLSSKPDSLYTIFLDFDGHVTSNTSWNRYNDGGDIVSPRFALDGDTEKTSFSASEKAAIYDIWLRVAEDYMPFDVNVTTVEPSSASFAAGRSQRVVIGGKNDDWYTGSVLGISYRSSFPRAGDIPNFVFSGSIGYDINGIAVTASHEVGHTLGLGHKGKGKRSYFSGLNGWGPIMGNPLSIELTQWSKGEYADATDTVDELLTITTKNGFGYRDDDYADTLDGAEVLSITDGVGEITGIVERNTDVDCFVFESDGSALDFFVGGISWVTNLDVLVKLYSEDYELIWTYDPSDRLDVEFLFTEAAGTYFLTVEGTGCETGSPGIYSDYGSLGSYTVRVGSPSTLVVTTLEDSFDSDGFLSLREALLLADDRAVITFDPSLAGGTIQLADKEIIIDRRVTVDASPAGGITVCGSGTGRVLRVYGGSTDVPVTLIGLTITGGGFGYGAGIYNVGWLKLVNCVLTGNTATSNGGGIYSTKEITLVNSTLSGNTAPKGGGLSVSSGKAELTNTIVALNDAATSADLAGTWTGTNNIVGTDPGFVTAPIFEDGVLVNGDSLDLSLAEGSTAIDAGLNSAVTTETDIAGHLRIVNGTVDIGAYEYREGETERLTAPAISTGSGGFYVSCGANRHQIDWTAVENASGYELQYSADGRHWTTVSAVDTAAVVTGLTYGQDMKYRVRALGTGSYTNSDWSEIKTFNVCPMDIDGDDFIGPGDNAILSAAWFSNEEKAGWNEQCDIDGDGFIGPGDYSYLSSNWFLASGSENLCYPKALAADIVFAEYRSADPETELGDMSLLKRTLVPNLT
ncbi:MAG: hypothetical protein IJG60_07360 [Thermoguttaceae bacterium]|nr:hypothetical protein [Thermoguttaceae bacterium]